MKPTETILKTAYEQAQKAFKEDEVPVGAVIYNSNTGEIISIAYNETENIIYKGTSSIKLLTASSFPAVASLNNKVIIKLLPIITITPIK